MFLFCAHVFPFPRAGLKRLGNTWQKSSWALNQNTSDTATEPECMRIRRIKNTDDDDLRRKYQHQNVESITHYLQFKRSKHQLIYHPIYFIPTNLAPRLGPHPSWFTAIKWHSFWKLVLHPYGRWAQRTHGQRNVDCKDNAKSQLSILIILIWSVLLDGCPAAKEMRTSRELSFGQSSSAIME